jgi:hypothetical protein
VKFLLNLLSGFLYAKQSISKWKYGTWYTSGVIDKNKTFKTNILPGIVDVVGCYISHTLSERQYSKLITFCLASEVKLLCNIMIIRR